MQIYFINCAKFANIDTGSFIMNKKLEYSKKTLIWDIYEEKLHYFVPNLTFFLHIWEIICNFAGDFR